MTTYARGHQSTEWLKLSHDRKVSPRGIYQESRDRWIATVPNSFGLPAGVSCPGRTPFCDSCYGVNAERRGAVAALLAHNYRLLTEAGTVDGMALLIDEMVSRYAREAHRIGLAPAEWLFRVHWDGDFFSEGYAQAWALVMRANPAVRFWAYTRSFSAPVDVVPVLADVANLTLYLSVDEHNATEAAAAGRRSTASLNVGGPCTTRPVALRRNSQSSHHKETA